MSQSELLSLPINTLDGEPTTLGAHTGKATLLVNVASKCGLTPQYAVLEGLAQDYADRGLAVIGLAVLVIGVLGSGLELGYLAALLCMCFLDRRMRVEGWGLDLVRRAEAAAAESTTGAPVSGAGAL